MPDPPYQPIACSVYDRIEQAAVRGTHHVVRYTAPDGSEVDARGRVADVFSRGGAEYLQVDGGPTIRLDRVRALDDAPRPDPGSDTPDAGGEI